MAESGTAVVTMNDVSEHPPSPEPVDRARPRGHTDYRSIHDSEPIASSSGRPVAGRDRADLNNEEEERRAENEGGDYPPPYEEPATAPAPAPAPTAPPPPPSNRRRGECSGVPPCVALLLPLVVLASILGGIYGAASASAAGPDRDDSSEPPPPVSPSSTTSAGLPAPSIRWNIGIDVQPYTKLGIIGDPGGSNLLFYQSDFGQLTFLNTSVLGILTELLDSSRLQNGTVLAAAFFSNNLSIPSVVAPLSGQNYSYIFYTDVEGYLTFLGANSSSSEYLPQQSPFLASDPSSSVVSAVATIGIGINGQHQLANKVKIYTCRDGDISEYSMDLGDSQLDYVPPFLTAASCDTMAVLRHGDSSYFFVRPDANSTKLQIWHTNWTDPHHGGVWSPGPSSPMDVPLASHFCADGDLFVFEAADGSLQRASIDFNEVQANLTAWGTLTSISPPGLTVPGINLACRWTSPTDMSVYYQAADSSLWSLQPEGAANQWTPTPLGPE